MGKKPSIIEQLCEKIDNSEVKDLFAGVALLYGMYIISTGVNGVVSGLVIAATAYYFRKRIE